MLRFLTTLLGPVFAKEAIETSRRKRHYFVRVLYGLILLLMMYSVWESYDYYFNDYNYGYYYGYGYGYGNRIAMMAEFARSLFIGICILQYGAVLLFVPIVVCGVIAGEREADTLELLFTTHLTDREIVLGKLASRMALILSLIASTLPVMALTMLWGGIEPGALLRSQLATLMAMFVVASVSIFFSSISRSPTGALIRTYWWLALGLVAPPFISALLIEGLVRSPNHWLAYLLWLQTYINPLMQFGFGLTAEGHDEISRYLGDWYFPFTFVLPLLFSCVLLRIAVYRLRIAPAKGSLWSRLQGWLAPENPSGRLHSPSLAIEPAQQPVTASTQVAPVIAELVEPDSAEPSAPTSEADLPTPQPPRAVPHFSGPARGERTWWGLRVMNPLWLRARRARVYDRDHHVGRIIWACWGLAVFFFLLVAVTMPRDIDDEECAMAFLSITWLVIALLAAVVSSTSLVSDRRRGFLDLLMCSPMEPREIVDGSVLAVVHHIRWLLPIPFALSGMFMLVGAINPISASASLLTGLLFVLLIIVNGVVTSLPARSAPQSLIPTFLMPVLMVVGVPMMIIIFEEGSAPLTWLIAIFGVIISIICVQQSYSAAATGAWLISLHLGLACLATCWNFSGHEEYPLLSTNPGYWVIGPLDMRLSRGVFSDQYWYDGAGIWPVAIGLYWLALCGNLVAVRGWCLANFDKLAGRLSIQRPASPPISAPPTNASPAPAVEAAVSGD